MFKVNNKDIRKTPRVIVNFEHISHFFLNFEQVNADWEYLMSERCQTVSAKIILS